MKLTPKSGTDKRTVFEQRLEAHLTDQLEPGENLLGFAAASQQKGMFSGGVVALGVTGERLLIQPLGRRGRELKGPARSITRPELTKARVGRAGGGWDDPSAVIMSKSAITIKLKTTSGEKFKFTLMDGSGIFGSLAGSSDQRGSVEAIVDFLD